MDNFYSINVNQIQKNRQERDKLKFTTYKRILEKCYLKIKQCSDKDLEYCIYNIPEFILGEPLFNTKYCAEFLIEHLQMNGFNAKFVAPRYVFIAWTFGREKKFEGFRQTNGSQEKPLPRVQKKMIDFVKPENSTSINIDTSTDDEDKKFRIINEYVPTKNLFFKKKL